jgi:excisionase family DNA binding protein
MKPTGTSRHLASIEDAAERYGVHPRTLRRRIADGTITGYRIAGGRLIRVDLIECDERLVQPIPAGHRFGGDAA